MKSVISGGGLFPSSIFSFRSPYFYQDLSLFKERDHNVIETVVRKGEIPQFLTGAVFQIEAVVLQTGREKRFIFPELYAFMGGFQHSREIKGFGLLLFQKQPCLPVL